MVLAESGRVNRWTRSWGTYSPWEKRAITFLSRDERNKAVDLCWYDPDLKGVPRGIGNGLTMIIPEEAVEVFREKGLVFEVFRVIGSGDLSPHGAR